MMTKKDYRAIGHAIREAFTYGVSPRDIAERVADVFAKDNPSFDRKRFLRFVETGKDKP